MRIDVLNPRLLPYAVTLGFLGAGAVMGLVIATGNLVMIALVIGGVTGLMLLNALPVAVWLILFGVLLVSGPLAYFFPGLAKLSWLFSLLGVFMAGAAFLYGMVGREAPARPLPAFVILALLFAVLAGLGAFFSDGPLAEISSGAKRQFQFWGVLLLLAVVPFKGVTVKRWMLFLLVVALAQLPFSLYQRLVLVPQVMGYERPGFVPFDIVVGTFEGSIFGGGASAIMAMFQVLAAAALFSAWREKLIGGLRCILVLVPVVTPLALGETKVVLFLIPVVLLGCFYDSIAKRPLAFLGGALVTMLLGGVLAYVYFAVQVSGEVSTSENLANTFAYNFGELGYYGTGVNRLTAVPYWFQSQTWAEPLRALFGYGVGSAYGMDGRVPAPGHIFVAHSGMYIDLVAASQILWETGIVGGVLFFGTIAGAIVSAMRNLAEAQSAWDRTICRTLLGALAVTVVMTFYGASVIVLVTHSFLLAFLLGLVAWRARHGPLELDAGDLANAGAKPGGGSGGKLRGRKFKHWSATDMPGFAGGFDPGLAAGAASSGAPVAGFAQGRFTEGSEFAARPVRVFRPQERPAPDSEVEPSAGRSAERFRRASSDASPEPMFATDDELDEVLPDGHDANQRRRDASRRRDRIDPVIDVRDVDPLD